MCFFFYFHESGQENLVGTLEQVAGFGFKNLHAHIPLFFFLPPLFFCSLETSLCGRRLGGFEYHIQA